MIWQAVVLWSGVSSYVMTSHTFKTKLFGNHRLFGKTPFPSSFVAIKFDQRKLHRFRQKKSIRLWLIFRKSLLQLPFPLHMSLYFLGGDICYGELTCVNENMLSVIKHPQHAYRSRLICLPTNVCLLKKTGMFESRVFFICLNTNTTTTNEQILQPASWNPTVLLSSGAMNFSLGQPGHCIGVAGCITAGCSTVSIFQAVGSQTYIFASG